MKIGERGQVTIPKPLREKYGLMPHLEVEFIPFQEGVLMRKKGRSDNPVDEVFGILKEPGSTDRYIDAIRGR